MAETVGEALIEVMPDLGDFEDTLVGGVADASEEAAEAATDALGEITESAEEAAEETVEAFEDAGEEIAGQFEEASEEATDSLDELAEAVEDVADESIEAFEGAGEEIADQFEEASEDAVDALGEISEAASDTFDEVVDATEEAGDAIDDVAESAGDIGTAFDAAATDVEASFDGVFTGIADDAGAAADDASAALSDIDINVGDLSGAFDGLVDEAESAGAEIADAISGGAAEAEDSLESLSSVGTATLDEVNAAAGDAGDELAGAFGAGEAAALGSLGAVADAGGGIGAALDDGSALATGALLTIAFSTRQTASRMRDLGDTSEEVSQQITDAAEQASEAIEEIEPPDFGETTVPPLPEPPDRGSFDDMQEGAEEVSEGLRVTFANGFEQVLVTARNAVTQIVTLLHDIAGSGEAPIVAQAMADAFDQGAQEAQAAVSRAIEQITTDLQSISEEEPDEAVARGFDVAAGEIAATFSQLRETAFEELTQFGVAGDEAAAVLKNTLLGALTSIMDALNSTAEEAESTARVLSDNVPGAIQQISSEVETVRGGMQSAFAGARDDVITSMVGMSDDVVAQLHRIAGSGESERVTQAMVEDFEQAAETINAGIGMGLARVSVHFQDFATDVKTQVVSADEAFEMFAENLEGHIGALRMGAEDINIEFLDEDNAARQSDLVESVKFDLVEMLDDLRAEAIGTGRQLTEMFVEMEDAGVQPFRQAVEQVFAALQSDINESIRGAEQTLDAATTRMVEYLHRIAGSGAASEVAEALRQAFEGSVDDVAQTFDQGIVRIIDGLTGVMQEGESVSAELSGQFDELSPAIETAMVGALANFQGVLDQFGASTDRTTRLIESNFETVGEQIQHIMEGAIEGIDTDFDLESPDLDVEGVFDALQEDFASISDDLARALAEMFTRIRRNAQVELEGVGSVADEVTSVLTSDFEGAADVAERAVGGATNQMVSDLQELGEGFGTLPIEERMEGMQQQIIDALAPVGDEAEGIFRDIGLEAQEASDVVTTALTGVMRDVVPNMDAALNAVGESMQQFGSDSQEAIGTIEERMDIVAQALVASMDSAFDALIASTVGMTDEMVEQLHRIAGSGAASEVAEALRASLTEAVEALGPVFQSLPDLVRTNFDQVESGAMSTTEAVRDAFDLMGERVAIAFQDPRSQAIQALTDMGIGARDASRVVMEAFDGIGETVDEVVGPVRSVAEGIADVAGAEAGAEVVGRLGEGMSDLRSSIEPTIDDLQSLIVSLEGVEQQGDAFDQIVSGLGEMESEEDIFAQMESSLEGAGQDVQILLDAFRALMDAESDPLETFRGAIVGARNQVDLLREAMHEAMDLEEAGDVDIFLGEKFEEVGQTITQSMQNAKSNALDSLNDIDVSDETQGRISDAFDQVIGDVGHMFAALETQFQENMEGVGDSAAEAALAAEQPLSDLAAALEVTIPGATQVAIDALDGMAVQTQSEIANASSGVDVESFGTLGEQAAAAVTEPMEGLRGILRQVFVDARDDAITALQSGDFETAAAQIEEDLSIDPAAHIGDLRDEVLEQLQSIGVDSIDVTNSVHSAFARLQDEIAGIFNDMRFFASDAFEGADGDAEIAAENIAESMQSGMADVGGAIDQVISIARQRIRGMVNIHQRATEEMVDDWEDPRTAAEQSFDHISDTISTAFSGAAETASEVVQDAVNAMASPMEGAFEGLDPEEAAERVEDVFSDIDLSQILQNAMDEAEETLSQQGISGAAITGALQANIDVAAGEMAEALEGGLQEGMAAVEDAVEQGRNPMEALRDAVGDLSNEFETSLASAAENAAQQIADRRWQDAIDMAEDLGGSVQEAFESMREAGEAMRESGDDLGDFVDQTEAAAEGVEEISQATEVTTEELESMTEAAEQGLGAAAEAAEELNEALEDTEEWVEDALQDGAASADDFAEAVEDAAEEVEESLGDDVVDAVEDVQDALAEDAVEAAEEFGESVEDAADDAQDALGETADSVEGFTDAVDDAVDQVGDAASEMGDSFGGFSNVAMEAGEEVEDSLSDSLQGTADIGSEVTDDLQQMFIQTADAVGDNFAQAAENVGDSLEEEAAGRGMAAFAEMEDAAEETAANVEDAFDGVGGGISGEFDTAAGGAEGGGGRISTAMAGAAGAAAGSSGKIATLLASSVVKFGAWATAGVAAAGAVVEAFAQSQQELNVQLERIDAALSNLARGAARELAVDLTNAARPIEDVGNLLELAQQRGLRTREELSNFTSFWDTVGDATGESAVQLGRLGTALKLVGVEVGNEEQALAAFGFVAESTDAEVSDLLSLIERAGQEFGAQAPDINEMAGALGLLESEGFRAQRAQRLLQRELRQTDGDLVAALDAIGVANADQLPEFIAKVEESGDVIERNAEIFGDFQTPGQAIASVWSRLNVEIAGSTRLLKPFTNLIEDSGDVLIGWVRAFREGIESGEGFTGALESMLEDMGLVHEIVDTPPAFHEVADEATAAFHEVADDSRGIFDLIFEALGYVISGLGSFIADNSDAIVSGILAVKSAVVDAGLALFQGLVDALPKLIPDVVDGLVDLVGALSTVLVESTPAIIEGAVDLLTGLLEAIPIVLPMIVDGAADLVLAITQALADNAESLITAGVDALLVLIDGIVEALPVLIETIGVEVLPALVDAIVDNLPMIIEAGVDLIVALVDGLAKAIPQIIDAVFTEIIPAVIKALNDNQPKIEAAAVDIGWALINGLLSILDALGQAVWDIADHIRRKLVEFLIPVIDAVVDWFRDLPGDAKVAVISQAFKLVEAGRDLVRGIWDGIKSMGDWLKRKLMSWAADVLPGPVADVLGLSSPSTVFAEMGRDVVRGLTEGIEDEEDDVIAEIERFANEMSSVDLMLGDPSFGAVEGDIDRAAARRRGGGREFDEGSDHIDVTVYQQPSETPVESTMRALRRTRYLSTAGRRGARR